MSEIRTPSDLRPQEPYENAIATAHGVIARVAVGATRWYASGLGIEVRFASLYTVPIAWARGEELSPDESPSAGGGAPLSVGLARRW